MIAQAFIDVSGRIFLALEREELRRAGLARRHVLRADKGSRARAFLRHADQSVLDHSEIFGLDGDGVA